MKNGKNRASLGQLLGKFRQHFIKMVYCTRKSMTSISNFKNKKRRNLILVFFTIFWKFTFFKNSTFSKNIKFNLFLPKSCTRTTKLLKIRHFMKYSVRRDLNEYKKYFYFFRGWVRPTPWGDPKWWKKWIFTFLQHFWLFLSLLAHLNLKNQRKLTFFLKYG